MDDVENGGSVPAARESEEPLRSLELTTRPLDGSASETTHPSKLDSKEESPALLVYSVFAAFGGAILLIWFLVTCVVVFKWR